MVKVKTFYHQHNLIGNWFAIKHEQTLKYDLLYSLQHTFLVLFHSISKDNSTYFKYKIWDLCRSYFDERGTFSITLLSKHRIVNLIAKLIVSTTLNEKG